MRIFREKEDCCGCGACVDSCQTGAVRMIRDKEGFQYPYIENSLCIRCGRCEKVCPIIHKSKEFYEHQYFGAQAKGEMFRFAGSSGGIFPVVAEYVLRNRGVVYGAGFDEAMKVVHREAAEPSQLEQIKKTKYVQSDMTGIYQSIEQKLKEGRWVLFCGTACQAHALRLFLNCSYEKLIIMDLVCYGVPSPGIWHDYVRYLERRHGGKMTEFYFRDKRNRDNGHTCAYIIEGIEYAGSLYQDAYCQMYFTNHILRPSCHSCEFCTVERDSDITIGDFWGIENVKPEIDDGMGTSIVILHTDQGKAVWDGVKQELNWFECQKEDLLQPRLIGPTDKSKYRREFMILYRILPFSWFVRGIMYLRKLKMKKWWKR